MILHASAVAMGGKGLLILGKSGSGKSGLALRLISLGASLVSDDQVSLELSSEGGLIARAPNRISELIEARGVGILRVDSVEEAPLVLAVDLDTPPEARQPQRRQITLLGCEVVLLFGRSVPNIDAVLAVLLRSGRLEPM
jgi:HPr kinase/phosphorylase